MAVLDVRHLYKIFGDRPEEALSLLEEGLAKGAIQDRTGCTVAVQDACFEVSTGELFVIMGLSGSGKSTLLRCLNRLVIPTRGQVRVEGEDVTSAEEGRLRTLRRTKMSMVFQNFGLLPHRSVLRNVEYGLEVSQVDKETRRRKAIEMLAQVGLQGQENRMPDELSGGMQQRVGLARALASEPEILLMDEPFSALDPLIRTEMQNELLNLQSSLHRTIVFITHDLDEALKLGDRIAIMKAGRIVQIGTPEKILTEPADDYVRSFVHDVDRTRILTASSLMQPSFTITLAEGDPESALRIMQQNDTDVIYAVDASHHLQGLLRLETVRTLHRQGGKSLRAILDEHVPSVRCNTPVAALLQTVLDTDLPVAVLAENDALKGTLDREATLAEVARNAGAARLPPSPAQE